MKLVQIVDNVLGESVNINEAPVSFMRRQCEVLVP